MEQETRLPASRRITGGIAALYLAAAYLVAMPYFILVVDYQGAGSPAERLALLAAHAGSMYAVTLITYVVFGLALAVLALALHDRFAEAAPLAARLVAGLGLVWAGLLVASGAVFNVGMENALGLRATDAEAAIAGWRTVETVADALGGAGGEIPGGTWVLLVGLAGLRSKRLPRALGWSGMTIGAVGLASAIPALRDAAMLFGALQIPWLAWLAVVLLRKRQPAGIPSPAHTELDTRA